MAIDVRGWIYTSWLLFFLGWLIWGITAKRAKRRQSIGSRVAQGAVITIAFWMLFWPALRIGPLRWRFITHSIAAESAAIGFTVIGFGIAIWARLHLGGNWSGSVTVKQEHRLVRSGPYTLVRHPIYSGLSFAALGLAVLNGDLGSLVAIGLMILGWRLKFRLEENFMTQEFGDTYLDYKRSTKALIPFLW
jgi:protein-S-isoprenylcysteine O-methyltransferase Ste14